MRLELNEQAELVPLAALSSLVAFQAKKFPERNE
jgi:hypothetical protein